MTNLLEKALIISFGIFTLMIFFILIMPFFEKINEIKENDRDELEEVNDSIEVIGFEFYYGIEKFNTKSSKQYEHIRDIDLIHNRIYINRILKKNL